MKRNSILYDYKPRLEWVDTNYNKGQKRRRKVLVLSLALTLGSAVVVGAKHFVSDSSLNPENLTLPLSSLQQDTTALENIHQPLALHQTISKKEPDIETAINTQAIPQEKPTSDRKVEKTTGLPFEPNMALASIEDTAVKTEEPVQRKDSWTQVTVKQGDNLSLIFSRLAISKNDLYAILSLGEETQSLKNLKPGQVLRLKFDNSRIEELVHESDLIHRLEVKKTEDDFQAKMIEEHPTVQISSSSGSIQDSLFVSGQKAGLSDNVIMQMFDIFGWDIDFVLDIRSGDQFHVIYEELIKDGEKIKDGDILAAEFVNQGNSYKAVRYEDSEGEIGYYTEQGQSMKKAFLRTPVNFTRISSHFNLNRKHPVLNTIRAHKGVDYAAPTGTPVQSTGKGKIVFAGKKNGYGNTVIIQHGGKYQTLYAHLTRFTRGLKKGKQVDQGQTVGYVGQTGLATGPHLHYEFRIDGAHRNPLTVKLPKSLPLPKQYMPDFEKQTKILIAQLDSMTNSFHLAKKSDTHPAHKDQPVIHLAERELSIMDTAESESNIH